MIPRYCSRSSHISLIQSAAEPLSKLGRLTSTPEVHVEQARLVSQPMVVQRRYLDTALSQCAGYRIDFQSQKYEIAGDRGAAIANRLKVQHGRYPHRGKELHAHLRNSLRARNCELEHIPAHETAGASERHLDGRRVQLRGGRR